jgi:hypothetical protein
MLSCHAGSPNDTPAREEGRTKRGASDLLSLIVQEIFSKECQTCLPERHDLLQILFVTIELGLFNAQILPELFRRLDRVAFDRCCELEKT